MTKDCHNVWDRCLRIIKQNVSPQSYRTWFEPIRPVGLDDVILTIQVPNKFFYEWLEEHYVQLLKQSIRQELGERGRLVYRIPENGQPESVSPAPGARAGAKPSAGRDNEPVPGVFDAEMIKNPFVIPGIRRVKVEPQLNPQYTFDNYIEGDCNRLARNAGLAIAKKPGGTSFNPLVIFGNVGLGKTHLAQAIGNDIVKNHEGKAVLYVSCEKFSNQIIQAIKNNAVNDFVTFYQMLDVLILDDIQFLSGKQKMQEIFFHIFNQLHQNKKQVVLTSDRAPKNLEGIEDRLISRFKWGLSADLQAPDLETRMAILESKINDEGVDIPMDVLEFICYNVKNNIRELEGVMVSLLAQSTLNRRDIDLDLANEVGNRRSAITLTLCDNKVFHVHNANDIIDIVVVFTEYWKSAETVFHGFVKRLSNGEIAIDKHRIGARHHDLANHGVAEFNNRLNEFSFFVFNDTLLRCSFNYP